jgi:hypothetical protein
MAEENEVLNTEAAEQPKPLSLLASEMFPNSYVGEPTEQPVETVTVDEGAEMSLEPVEGEEVTTAGEVEGETVTVETEEAGASSILDVQEYLNAEHGLELDFDEVVVPLKVNGKEVEMSIGDLKANSQKLEAADDILETAKAKVREERNQMQSELENKNNQATEALTTAATLVQNAEQLLANDRQNVDWEKLRAENPGEYSAMREDFKARQDAIDQVKNDAAMAYQNWQSQASQEAESVRQQSLVLEQEKLLEKLPEWQDEQVATKEKGQVVNFLQEVGFTNEEISLAGDHRLILLARDAMLFRSRSETVETAKKKIAKIPKVVKPGSKKTSDQRSSEQMKNLREQMIERPTVQNAFAILKAKRNQ